MLPSMAHEYWRDQDKTLSVDIRESLLPVTSNSRRCEERGGLIHRLTKGFRDHHLDGLEGNTAVGIAGVLGSWRLRSFFT